MFSEPWDLTKSVQQDMASNPYGTFMASKPLTNEECLILFHILDLYSIIQVNIRVALKQKARDDPSFTWNVAGMKDRHVLDHIAQFLLLPEFGLVNRGDIAEAAKRLLRQDTLRHRIAHWAVRKSVRGDVLIFMTANAVEAGRQEGDRLDARSPEALTRNGVLCIETEELKRLRKYIGDAARTIANASGEAIRRMNSTRPA